MAKRYLSFTRMTLLENPLEYVVLVDEQDNPLGIGEKLATHQAGLLHRAISVFLFNGHQQLLLQQRAFSKYHSGGLWTNTCCGHPRPEESLLEAAQRRLWEEMGIRCALNKGFHFIYKAEFDNHLMEYELDHVFVGYFEGDAKVNPLEVYAAKWVDCDFLLNDILHFPERYTVWFRLALKGVIDYLSLPDQPSLVRSVEK